MKDQLIKYVDLLFAGAPNASDIKQEILQNTLDRYDDLVAQGKQPAAAYSLAISGIGDINEILGSDSTPPAVPSPAVDPVQPITPAPSATPIWKKVLLAIAICLFIISIIPLIVLSELGMDTLGLCGTLAIVAVATTALIVASDGKGREAKNTQPSAARPRSELRKAVRSVITAVGLAIYFIVSFSTHAWYITWVIFPIMAATQGLVSACMDLKEAGKQ